MPTAATRHRLISRPGWRLTAAVLMVGAVTGVGAALLSPPASAAGDTVSNCSGDPTMAGSLPDVVAGASAGDTVTFTTTCPVGTPIVLQQTLAIGVDLTITGPGPDAMVVSGGHSVEVMAVASGVTASISGLTIEDGNAGTGTAGTEGTDADGTFPGGDGGPGGNGGIGSPGGDGGGIDNSGSLTLTDTVVSGNVAGAGGDGGPGGHANGGAGTPGIHDTKGQNGGNAGTGGNGGAGGNGGNGGGIDNSGTLSLIATAVTANAAGAGGGGGISGDAIGGGGGGVVGSPTAPGSDGGNGGNGGISGTGGGGGAGGSGGGIYNSGTVTLVASTVSDNAAGDGGAGGGSGGADGGVGGFGGVSEGDGQNGGNGGNGGEGGISLSAGAGGAGGGGGGIADTDAATLTNSTVAGNVAGTGAVGGGAGDADGGAGGSGGVAVHGGNAGDGGNGGSGGVAGNGGGGGRGGDGGGLTDGGSLTLTSNTIASNGAGPGGNGGDGGGATLGGGGPSGGGGGTVGGNGFAGLGGNDGPGGTGATAGGVLASGTVDVGATIVSDNAPANCDLVGTVTDSGSNLDSGTSCGFALSSDIDNADPLLGPLQANGGPTDTMAPSLSPPSPVIDVVPADQCPATDQRGAPRTAPCDIGAYDTDQAPFISAIDVAVSGSQTFGSDSPTFTETNDAPAGVTVTGPSSCATVDGGTAITSDLAVGDYTIDASSCSGLTSSNAQYPIFPSTIVGVTGGFVVTKDTTTVGLTAVPSSESFGHEGSTLFTVTVLTGNGEELAGTEDVTVDVGSTTCVAPVSPATGGGSSSCFIGNSALGAGAYTASASYLGDSALQSSGPADAAFTVTLALTPPPLPNPLFDVPYSTTITAGGATAPTTFTEMGNLPDGIILHSNGVLSGTATNAAQIGTPFPFTVKATDSAIPANVATQLYTITVVSPCAANLTTIALSATARTGNFTGVFCVNAAGSGTYIQGTVHGTGSVTSAHGVTAIRAFGTDLSLLGQKTTTTSSFTETAPAPMKAGTFTLTTVAAAS